MGFKCYKIESEININGFFTAFDSYYTKHFEFEGEAHNFWEIMYIRNGRVSVSADERIYELKKGEMIFHKPMEFHKFTKISEEELDFFVMSFSATGKGMKNFENGVFILSPEQKYAFSNIIDFVRTNKKTGKNINVVSYAENFNSPRYISILKNLTELFLLRDMQNNQEQKPVLSTSETLIFKEAVSMMHKSLGLNLKTSDIAKKCSVSPSYIKNIFSKYTGIGVHEYFLSLKINEATRLLKEGKTVTETAELLSFSSQNYFSTVYKRITGISPNKVKT